MGLPKKVVQTPNLCVYSWVEGIAPSILALAHKDCKDLLGMRQSKWTLKMSGNPFPFKKNDTHMKTRKGVLSKRMTIEREPFHESGGDFSSATLLMGIA